ncbi:MAG: hypothetical protein ABIH85_05940 [Candidatus Omnitrophota bacterium]|nr:hypothetical protein [Candidatus Omnitrophota bacterium]
MIRSRGNKPRTHIAILGSLVLCFAVGSLWAETGIEDEKENFREERAGSEKNVDKKLDAVINVLKSVQEEVKQLRKSEGEDDFKAPKNDTQKNWARRFRKSVAKTKKLLVEIRKTVDSFSDEEENVDSMDDEQLKWTQDLDEKLDKTISAINIIREELKKTTEED